MYSVSDAFNEAVYNNVRELSLSGSITTSDGTTVAIKDSEIKVGSLTITRKSVPSSNFSIGGTFIDKLSVEISNKTKFNTLNLVGATITFDYTIYFGDNGSETLNLGVWKIATDGVFKTKNLIQLKANSNMILFDKAIVYEDDSESETNNTLIEGDALSLLGWCCNKCGVSLSTYDLSDFINTDVTLKVVDDGSCVTYRDVIENVCNLICAFATIDQNGDLVIKAMNNNAGSVFTINPITTASTKIGETVRVDRVTTIIGGISYATGSIGVNGVSYALDENPLTYSLKKSEVKSNVKRIKSRLHSMEITDFTIQYNGNPAIEPGDIITYNGSNYLVTGTVFKFRDKCTVSGAPFKEGNAKGRSKSSTYSSNSNSGGTGGGGTPYDPNTIPEGTIDTTDKTGNFSGSFTLNEQYFNSTGEVFDANEGYEVGNFGLYGDTTADYNTKVFKTIGLGTFNANNFTPEAFNTGFKSLSVGLDGTITIPNNYRNTSWLYDYVKVDNAKYSFAGALLCISVSVVLGVRLVIGNKVIFKKDLITAGTRLDSDEDYNYIKQYVDSDFNVYDSKNVSKVYSLGTIGTADYEILDLENLTRFSEYNGQEFSIEFYYKMNTGISSGARQHKDENGNWIDVHTAETGIVLPKILNKETGSISNFQDIYRSDLDGKLHYDVLTSVYSRLNDGVTYDGIIANGRIEYTPELNFNFHYNFDGVLEDKESNLSSIINSKATNKDLKAVESRVTKLEKDVEKLKSDVEALKSGSSGGSGGTSTDISELETRVSNLSTQVNTNLQSIQSLNSQLQTQSQELATLKETVDNLGTGGGSSTDLTEIQGQIQSLQGQIQSLQEQVSNQGSTISNNTSVINSQSELISAQALLIEDLTNRLSVVESKLGIVKVSLDSFIIESGRYAFQNADGVYYVPEDYMFKLKAEVSGNDSPQCKFKHKTSDTGDYITDVDFSNNLTAELSISSIGVTYYYNVDILAGATQLTADEDLKIHTYRKLSAYLGYTNSGSQTHGTTSEYTAEANYGLPKVDSSKYHYEYKFVLRVGSETAEDVVLQDWGTSNKCSFTTNYELYGNRYCYIYCYMRDGFSQVSANRSIYVAELRLSISASTTSTTVGSPVTITATPKYGGGEYQYRYSVSSTTNSSSERIYLTDWVSDNTYVYTPTVAEKRHVFVEVKDQFGVTYSNSITIRTS